jgi:hypothetical protein
MNVIQNLQYLFAPTFIGKKKKLHIQIIYIILVVYEFRLYSFTQYYENCNIIVKNDTLIRVIIIIINGMSLLRLHMKNRSAKDKF